MVVGGSRPAIAEEVAQATTSQARCPTSLTPFRPHRLSSSVTTRFITAGRSSQQGDTCRWHHDIRLNALRGRRFDPRLEATIKMASVELRHVHNDPFMQMSVSPERVPLPGLGLTTISRTALAMP